MPKQPTKSPLPDYDSTVISRKQLQYEIYMSNVLAICRFNEVVSTAGDKQT
jgi:hypothetical protein